MRGRRLILAALAGVAVSANAADVQFFGINVPEAGKWAVYSRISNSDAAPANQSAGIQKVTGLASLSINVLNNGAATVNTVVNSLPFGTTTKTDILDDTQPAQPVGYGFWLFRDASLVTGGSHVQGAQYTSFSAGSAATLNKFVLQGPGLTGGTQAADGTNFTSATNWQAPLAVAQGTYTVSGSTGLTLDSPTASLLRDADPSAAINWSGPGHVESATNRMVIDPRYVTGQLAGSGVGGLTGSTYKAGLGDATLDGLVNLDDLVVLANHYGTAGTWFDGDFTLDGQVNLDDLVVLANHYGVPVPGSAVGADFAADFRSAFSGVPQVSVVPEPASILGLVIAGFSMLGRSRRRDMRATR